MPFGGYKQSGVGREIGLGALLAWKQGSSIVLSIVDAEGYLLMRGADKKRVCEVGLSGGGGVGRCWSEDWAVSWFHFL
ncbi:hypothetical protein BDV98DRAFT_574055 [Pterulicium gracile]|uniref:Aldehyde dehydrogenase domain-containing protein n=1 Tax=Pterulicium gracile TaxID=1884261 RepID=A0A5C3Q6S8_9AGAR|nr:hypothetical protein BDV98DRAFT_574055 [Pterula gracilis]